MQLYSVSTLAKLVGLSLHVVFRPKEAGLIWRDYGSALFLGIDLIEMHAQTHQEACTRIFIQHYS